MEDKFICPHPLEATTENIHLTVYAAPNCAIPCPTIMYSTNEWDNLVLTLKILSFISLVLSSLSFLAHVIEWEKYFIRCMFISGFFVSSTIMCSFFMVNKNNAIVCDTAAHYVQRNGFCMFQASSLIFLFIWVETWSVIFAYDMFLHIASIRHRLSLNAGKQNKKYLAIALSLSIIVTLIPLCADNVGFDYEASIPFCLYLVSENNIYFWITFFVPMCLLILIAIVYALMSFWRIHQIIVMSSITGAQSTSDWSFFSGAESVHSPLLPQDGPAGLLSSMIRRDIDSVDSSFSEGLSSVTGPQPDRDSSRYAYSVLSSVSALPRGILNEYAAEPPVIPSVLGNSAVKSPESVREMDENSEYSGVSGETSRETSVNSKKNRGLSHVSSHPTLFTPLAGILPSTNIMEIVSASWKYNRLSIVFVLCFCVSTLCIAPMLFVVDYVYWEKAVNSGENFAACLVKASLNSIAAGVDQTQEDVDQFARQMCGEVPSYRPNQLMVNAILIFASAYGIIPSLIFGFAGRFSGLWK